MSLIKKIVIAIAALLAVTLISAVLAYKFVDDQTIEDQVLKVLRDTLKRDIRINGEFTLTRSLDPTLRATQVHIPSADWDTGNDLIRAETFEIGIALPDLLKGNLTIQDFLFEDAVINLKRNTEGKSNLDFSSGEPDIESKENETGAAFDIDVIDINIKNLVLNYVDEQSDRTFTYLLDDFLLHPKNKDIIQIAANSQFDQQSIAVECEMCRIRSLLKGEDCTITADVATVPFETNIKGDINISNQGKVDLKLKSHAENINALAIVKDLSLPNTDTIQLDTHLKGAFNRISAKGINAKVAFEETVVEANGNIQSVNSVEGIDLSISADADQPTWLDNYQQVLDSRYINKITASASIQDDKGSIYINNLNSTIELEDTSIITTGSFTIHPQLELALQVNAKGKHPVWLNELQQAIAAEEIDEFSIDAHIDGQMTDENQTINIHQLVSNIVIKDTKLSAKGNIDIAEENHINVDLAIKTEGKNLQGLDEALNQALPESDKFFLSTQLNFADETLQLSGLDLALDKTQLQGSSKIQLTSPPSIQANLKADTLDLGILLAVTQTDKKENKDEASSDKKQNSLFSDETIPLDSLKAANTKISLSIKNLLYKDTQINDIEAILMAKNNSASIDIPSLKYKGVNLNTRTSVNANDNSYTYNLLTENFDLGALLSDLHISKNFQGKIDASVDINSIGRTSKQIASNANGKITLVMTEGSLTEAPIDLLASNLLVELMPGKKNKDNTKIECLFVQFSGKNGVFSSDAALLNTENIVMTTTGEVDFTSEDLDLLLAPKPKNIELFTLDSNIRVAGDISDPGFSLDKASVFKKLLKTAATVALGPATLAVPFANMGGSKTEKCFSEVANTTTKALEAERLAKEQAEKEKLEEQSKQSTKEAVVEPLNF